MPSKSGLAHIRNSLLTTVIAQIASVNGRIVPEISRKCLRYNYPRLQITVLRSGIRRRSLPLVRLSTIWRSVSTVSLY